MMMTMTIWMAYKQTRNHCTTATRQAKRSFFTTCSTNKQQSFWSHVKACTGLGKIKRIYLSWHSSSPALRKASADIVNMHFVNSVSVIVNSLKSTSQASPKLNSAQLSNSESQTNLKFSFSAVTAA